VETEYSRNQWGYGRCNQIRFGKKIYLAHVLAWVDHHGMLPPESKPHILHTCDNPPCVNPEHLWAGTHAENMRDMSEKGRVVSAKAQWTQCPNNHEFTPENTLLNSNGRRYCRECRNARRRKNYALAGSK
jgi:hypothetical protein